MDDTSHSLKPWVIFAGGVLVIVVLYWAQAVLVPIALAVLLTFVLTPAVAWLERWLSRVTAVLAAATLVFIVLASPAGVSRDRWTMRSATARRRDN
jgi:predicted PurR-regulated permease PerM